ncbi:MAG: radical SAM protein [Spirochaetes bacterium]|nr:radical SAM protein [Spirochaetota bacterium]
MRNKYLIADFFIDEPACLGVPPFMSPYPRYVYGALMDAGINEDDIEYATADYFRENNFLLNGDYKLVIIIGGAVVPGKYLGYKIGTAAEINRLISCNKNQLFSVGGLISHVIENSGENIIRVINDIEKFAFTFAAGSPADTARNYDEIKKWSVYGAAVVKKHPDFPLIICEIESYRGCPRQFHCSFCSESIKSRIEFREAGNIISEVQSLIDCGVSRFRIGSQPDILCYKSGLKEFRNGFPKPEISPLAELFSGLKNLRDSFNLRTLNIDNANPGTIYNFPDLSSEILSIIADSITPGDTLPLGVESFDPEVIRLNNLKGSRENMITAVEIINACGGRRIDGIPVLLPGINLIHGLNGETENTFRINYESLLEIQNRGLLLKRINIRKLLKFPGTPIAEMKYKISDKTRNRYDYFKEKIRSEIDHYMLQKVYPEGTVLKDVRIEEVHNGYSMGKQLQSYSITNKIPADLKLKSLNDVIVTGYRERSLNSLPLPLKINSISGKALQYIEGISKKGSSEIILKRPLKNKDELLEISPNIKSLIVEKIDFS